ncbi:hypothetical protein JW960_00680 [candidate division KSB1 bacterium]|nr:hypothetical protein [candidate division KSB1 bacterium]
MITKKGLCFFLSSLLLLFDIGFAKDIINIRKTQKESKELIEFAKFLDLSFEEKNVLISPTLHKTTKIKESMQDVMIVNTESFKKMISLDFFSDMLNPILREKEYLTYVDKNRNERIVRNHRFASSFLLLDRTNYCKFDFKFKKYYLWDLYFGPYVFIGTITNIDTIDMSYQKYSPVKYMVAYKMDITDCLNKYFAFNKSVKELHFVLSPFHRGPKNVDFVIEHENGNDPLAMPLRLTKKNYIELNGKYLIYLTADKINALDGTVYENLPHLYVNVFGIECFPLVENRVINSYHYFGNDYEVQINDAKMLIHAILDEIYKWKE